MKKLTNNKLVPPVTSFPNGWFCISYSNEISPGQVKPLKYFGRDLVLFRSESGKPYLLNAHCPHLGTYLGYGKVTGESIQCPLHGLCFDGQGNSFDLSNTTTSFKGKARSWPISEKNGVIMVYYHAQGHLPTWEIPTLLEEPIKGKWNPFVQILQRKARTHVQDLVQGVFDFVHAKTIHHAAYVAKCENIGVDGPISYDTYSLFIKIPFPINLVLGKERKIYFDLTHYGLGYSIVKQIAFQENASPFQIIKVFNTPIDNEYCETRILSSIRQIINKPITNALIPFIVHSTKIAYEEDLPILENRSRYHMPLLSHGDGPIAKFRLWTRQFYV